MALRFYAVATAAGAAVGAAAAARAAAAAAGVTSQATTAISSSCSRTAKIAYTRKGSWNYSKYWKTKWK